MERRASWSLHVSGVRQWPLATVSRSGSVGRVGWGGVWLPSGVVWRGTHAARQGGAKPLPQRSCSVEVWKARPYGGGGWGGRWGTTLYHTHTHARTCPSPSRPPPRARRCSARCGGCPDHTPTWAAGGRLSSSALAASFATGERGTCPCGHVAMAPRHATAHALQSAAQAQHTAHSTRAAHAQHTRSTSAAQAQHKRSTSAAQAQHKRSTQRSTSTAQAQHTQSTHLAIV